MSLLLIASLLFPALFRASTEGPGFMRAPWIVALAAGLVVGALAQRSRFCTMGGIRDAILFRDFHLLWGAIAIVVTVILGNLILGKFYLGFGGRPSPTPAGSGLFLGMALVGWGSVLWAAAGPAAEFVRRGQFRRAGHGGG